MSLSQATIKIVKTIVIVLSLNLCHFHLTSLRESQAIMCWFLLVYLSLGDEPINQIFNISIGDSYLYDVDYIFK